MTTNTPDFIVYGVTQQAGKKDILTRVGGAWKHTKGDGINVQIRALPLNFDGKIVLFPPKDDEAGAAQAPAKKRRSKPGLTARPSGRAVIRFLSQNIRRRSMKITRTSPLTGQTNTLDLPIDRRSLRRWLNGEPVQHCFPDLDAAQREFIMTGYMPGEYEISREPDDD